VKARLIEAMKAVFGSDASIFPGTTSQWIAADHLQAASTQQ
jgi:hypothetical protein